MLVLRSPFLQRRWVRALLVCVAVLIGATNVGAANPAQAGAPVVASVAKDVDADEGVVLAGGIDDLFVVSKALPMPLHAPHDGASWARFRLTADWPQTRGPVVRVVNTAGQTVTVGFAETASQRAAAWFVERRP